MTLVARVTGERFDADHIQWACDECGRSEYDCECEPESNAWPRLRDFPGGVKPEVEARIARFVNPTGWELAEQAALEPRERRAA
jgi:hypothetical protein